MSDKEKLDLLCYQIKHSGLIVTEERQKEIDESWNQLSKTSTQKRALLDRQLHRVSQKQKHSE